MFYKQRFKNDYNDCNERNARCSTRMGIMQLNVNVNDEMSFENDNWVLYLNTSEVYCKHASVSDK